MIDNYQRLWKIFRHNFETIRFIINIAKMCNFKGAYCFPANWIINLQHIKSVTFSHVCSLDSSKEIVLKNECVYFFSKGICPRTLLKISFRH